MARGGEDSTRSGMDPYDSYNEFTAGKRSTSKISAVVAATPRSVPSVRHS